jgi:hypothetical protein
MESLFLLAFGEEEFLAALAMASSEAFFNKLLIRQLEINQRFRFHPCQRFRMKPVAVLSVVFAGLLLAHGSSLSAAFQSAPPSNDPRTITIDVLKQSGLHLPDEVPSLIEFVAKQGAQTDCESISVEWTSLPGSKKLAREADADGPDFPETLSMASRKSFSICDVKTYRTFPATIPFFDFVVFGVSADGTIRGFQMTTDPRLNIVDCFVVPGLKQLPNDQCGRFIWGKGLVEIWMPRDPEIARLIFFVRKYDSPPGYWHIVRVGSVDLPSEALINKPAESSNSPGPN